MVCFMGHRIGRVVRVRMRWRFAALVCAGNLIGDGGAKVLAQALKVNASVTTLFLTSVLRCLVFFFE